MNLDILLTPGQQEKLAKLLEQLYQCGHGSLTIKVVHGKPKFIAVEFESKIDDNERSE